MTSKDTDHNACTQVLEQVQPLTPQKDSADAARDRALPEPGADVRICTETSSWFPKVASPQSPDVLTSTSALMTCTLVLSGGTDGFTTQYLHPGLDVCVRTSDTSPRKPLVTRAGWPCCLHREPRGAADMEMSLLPARIHRESLDLTHVAKTRQWFLQMYFVLHFPHQQLTSHRCACHFPRLTASALTAYKGCFNFIARITLNSVNYSNVM